MVISMKGSERNISWEGPRAGGNLCGRSRGNGGEEEAAVTEAETAMAALRG